jgi:hypothetical protein
MLFVLMCAYIWQHLPLLEIFMENAIPSYENFAFFLSLQHDV